MPHRPLVLLRPDSLRSRESFPWTRVLRTRYAENREAVVRHVLDPITREHVGPDGVGYVPTFGYLTKHDVGRRLVVDVACDPESEWKLIAHVE